MIINEVKLKESLKKKGITKSALCDEIGISSRTIAKIGKGEDINDKVAQKIAEFLGVENTDLVEDNVILKTLQTEKKLKVSGGLYHETQIKLTYNSNHIEGSKLTEEQTRYIFETKTVGELPSNVQIDDIIETNNHFRCRQINKLKDIKLELKNKYKELEQLFRVCNHGVTIVEV